MTDQARASQATTAAQPLDLDFVVRLYPDPVLRRRAREVPVDDETRAVVKAMFTRMVKSDGCGLAAPQVGLDRRILVLNPTGKPEDDLALVNPTIKERKGGDTLMDEGCLSFPRMYAEIKRPERCVVEYQDLDGARHEREFDGFVARIIQHEYDHLEGVLLVDRMTPADKSRNRAGLEALVDKWKRAQGR
jgi:peptide deformylase